MMSIHVNLAIGERGDKMIWINFHMIYIYLYKKYRLLYRNSFFVRTSKLRPRLIILHFFAELRPSMF